MHPVLAANRPANNTVDPDAKRNKVNTIAISRAKAPMKHTQLHGQHIDRNVQNVVSELLERIATSNSGASDVCSQHANGTGIRFECLPAYMCAVVMAASVTKIMPSSSLPSVRAGSNGLPMCN
jgi:hypothetical protein